MARLGGGSKMLMKSHRSGTMWTWSSNSAMPTTGAALSQKSMPIDALSFDSEVVEPDGWFYPFHGMKLVKPILARQVGLIFGPSEKSSFLFRCPIASFVGWPRHWLIKGFPPVGCKLFGRAQPPAIPPMSDDLSLMSDFEL